MNTDKYRQEIHTYADSIDDQVFELAYGCFNRRAVYDPIHTSVALLKGTALEVLDYIDGKETEFKPCKWCEDLSLIDGFITNKVTDDILPDWCFNFCPYCGRQLG